MAHRTTVAALASVLFLAGPAAANPPASWDGLVQVKSQNADLLYLQPGADFRGYTKVVLDPTEVAFRKNWRRDYNMGNGNMSRRVSERDEQDVVTKGIAASNDIFRTTWEKAGFEVVSSPGPDVLRVRNAVLNINVTSPDQQSAERVHTYSDTAGDAMFVVEVRDSTTNALLGRVVDARVAGDNTVGWRSSAGNRSDFRRLVEEWAKLSVQGLAQLKARSPIAP